MRLALFVCLIAFIPLACSDDSSIFDDPPAQPWGTGDLSKLFSEWTNSEEDYDFSIEIVCVRDSAPRMLGPLITSVGLHETTASDQSYGGSGKTRTVSTLFNDDDGDAYECRMRYVDFEYTLISPCSRT